ncbi:protein of unknown function DUF752 [Rippkaea orientalis PCC 8801]|uniref:MnmC-like methyltransferase domain-containing protein n=1 Tax=Rippkaea orientalis (strain PCC 8801 / RF-1) TaxID=41431 RepID=B7JYM3_RIPO1|nr:MnmC family methyltransferase [Rippkaea orientalis]ACK64893.1 protein of unknown function DUF752 [Rippkaea orientalis PCC 8801]
MFTPQLTNDGSYTFFSPEFEELFHSNSGAKQEAEEKFVKPCQLKKKAEVQTTLKILDICYGLGYNTAAALEAIWSVNPDCNIELIALENDPIVPLKAIEYQLLKQWISPIPEYLESLLNNHQVELRKFKGNLLVGDARKTIQTVKKLGFQADAIFLDPFSPPKCPQLWTVEFLNLVTQCLHPQGRLATYSSAAAVRVALQMAGLGIGSTRGVGRRSPGTVASFNRQDLEPLSQQEDEHLQTKASIPYRDPSLEDSSILIHERRRTEQQGSCVETTSQWKKRWTNLTEVT